MKLLPAIFKEKLAGTHHTLGYVNALQAECEPLAAVQAFHSLFDDFPEWKMKIIGTGSEYITILQYIQAHHLHHAVQLFGPLANQEIFDVMKRVDMLIVPATCQLEEDLTANVSLMGMPLILPRDHKLWHGDSEALVYVSFDDVHKDMSAVMKGVMEKMDGYDAALIRKNRLNHFGL